MIEKYTHTHTWTISEPLGNKMQALWPQLTVQCALEGPSNLIGLEWGSSLGHTARVFPEFTEKP